MTLSNCNSRVLQSRCGGGTCLEFSVERLTENQVSPMQASPVLTQRAHTSARPASAPYEEHWVWRETCV